MSTRKSLHPAVVWIGLALLCLLGCGGGTDSAGPDETLQAFYAAMNENRYDDARAMYTDDAQAMLSDPAQSESEDLFTQWAATETRSGTIESVRMLDIDTSEAGTTAEIRFEVRYQDGSSKQANVTAEKQPDETWRLGLIL